MQPLTCFPLKLAVASFLTVVSSLASAEKNDVIVTDRPDFVESADVVGKGRFQAEMSLAVDRTRHDAFKERNVSTPVLLRMGTGADWELRLETDGLIVQHMNDLAQGNRTTNRGYGDVSVGAKWHLLDENGAAPAVAVLAHVDLDSGSSAFRGNGLRPSLRVVAEWDLPNDMSLGIMPGIMRDRNAAGKRFMSGVFGVVIGKSLTEQTRAFVEIALPQIARAENGGSIASLDIGLAHLLSDRCQIDTAIYKGLNRRTADLTWTIGLSTKF